MSAETLFSLSFLSYKHGFKCRRKKIVTAIIIKDGIIGTHFQRPDVIPQYWVRGFSIALGTVWFISLRKKVHSPEVPLVLFNLII